MSNPKTVFSPLALTEPLPFLPLAQGDVDYDTASRPQPGLLDHLLDQDGTGVILVRGEKVAVPRGEGALSGRTGASIRLATLPAAYLRGPLASSTDQFEPPCYYLGKADQQAWLALDLDLACAGRVVHDPLRDLVQAADQRFDWLGLREYAPHGHPRQVGLAICAVALSVWHGLQVFCPHCGAPVHPCQAGWAQICQGNVSGDRHTLFPRIEPAVIMTVVDGHDRLLLQHNRKWVPGFRSVTAGFVEAGENLEHAGRREALEEVGLNLGEMRYLGSQPWPFPSSLMVAFKARSLNTNIRVDGQETEDAGWFTREEFSNALASGRLHIPQAASVARHMIEQWYGSEL
ncbi:NAD(+) diphosphatase [Bifidobacterium sp. B4081]|uniref:NAD(+) diphosphatase n=1 Tax=unclassified Bifidobacterium TaxID=2608897 RepID=UPI0022699E42|nr:MULTISPECIES: NAD(+) diphosphatase [unclassified Bifidobacterium]MCX8644864.1 NAD(+) diphosphatase [Bifidobacterium sp. B4077]MCX8646678.1 NAD(+) diphosphatase [Bifidobacterium sp. B4081]MCX8668463.1 NAD(+) diphosphatase [Bifidobacterium sp. B3998]MCX8688157.1 NAD(+) diphosphatase [Bifidobacterium sp. B4142]